MGKSTVQLSADVIARVVKSDLRPAVEVAVPSGLRFVDVLANAETLADLIAKLGPRGCEMCLSGRDIIIRERFDDVINVRFTARG